MAKKKVTSQKKQGKLEIKNMKKFWSVMSVVFAIFLILGAFNKHFDSLSFVMLIMCLSFLSYNKKEK